jgi:hypothetical protein
MNATLRRSAFFLVLVLSTGYAPHLLAISSGQDTDGDGMPDLTEDANGNGVMDTGETNPYDADTDGGGESDGSEVAAKRNPFDPTDDLTYDADGDGLVNGIELLKGTDPKNPDTDGDGIQDNLDPFPLDSKFGLDGNANNLPDEWEKRMGLDQGLVAATTVDDPDGDSLTNAEELSRGTNPMSVDTDRDGVDDKTEIDMGTDPRENPCLVYGDPLPPFQDMQSHWGEKIVLHLQRLKILPNNIPLIGGYQNASDGTASFAPNQPITRYEFLKMTLLSTCTKIRMRSDDASVTFRDVRKESPINERPETAFKRSIVYTALHYGIVEGYEDGNFHPDAPVNRAEALKILSLAALLEPLPPGNGTPVFTDVAPTDWFMPYTEAATSREIVRGYGDGTFRPGDPITRAEAAKIIYMTMLQNPTINGYVVPVDS